MIPNLFVTINELTKLTFLYVLAIAFGLESLTWVLTAWVICELIGSLALGWVSDKIGRRNILIFSLAMSLASIVILYFSTKHKNEHLLLYISTIVNGIFGNYTSTSKAAFIDTRPNSSKRILFAILNISISVPWILFPMTYLFFTPSLKEIILIDFLCTAFCVIVSVFFQDRKDLSADKKYHVFPFKNMYVTLAVLAFLLSQTDYQVGSYLVEERGSIIFISKAYFLFGLGFLVGSAACLFFKEGFNHRKYVAHVYIAGGVFFIMKFLSFSWETPTIFFDKFDFTLLALISGLYIPSVYAMLTEKAQVHQFGQVCGALESVQSLGEALAPRLSALLILANYDFVFLILAAVLIIAGLILNIPAKFSK